jgi:antitoxin ParD1/3/4
MQVTLTPQLEKMVQSRIDSGLYDDAAEVIRAALHLMEEHERAREEALRAAVLLGYEQAERGEVAPWTPELHAEIRRNAARKVREGHRPKADVRP